MKPRVRHALILSLPFVAYALLVVVMVTRPHAAVDHGDSPRYRLMTERPFDPDLAVDGPFRWRVGAPLVVGALPLPVDTGFLVLAVVSLAVATGSVVWMLKGMGVGDSDAAGGGLAFVLLGSGVALGLRNPVMTDPMSMALIGITAAAAVNGRAVPVALAIAAGGLVRETFVIGAIAAWFVAPADDKRRVRVATAAGVAVAVALAGWLRSALPSTPPYDPWLAAQYMATHSSVFSVIARVVLATGATWGWLLPLAVLQLMRPHTRHLSAGWLLMIAAAAAQILIAHDVERLTSYAFPAVIALATSHIAQYRARHGNTWWPWGILIVLQVPWALRFAGITPGLSTGMLGAGVVAVTLALAIAHARPFRTTAQAAR